MRVWQMEAIMVKTSSLAESLHTRLSRALVCCLESSLWTHSSVISCTDIRRSSLRKERRPSYVLGQQYGHSAIMESIIITIILVNIEITIIQTIIFEFENTMYLFSMSLPNNTL